VRQPDLFQDLHSISKVCEIFQDVVVDLLDAGAPRRGELSDQTLDQRFVEIESLGGRGGGHRLLSLQDTHISHSGR
jgi:hypothetical protein